MHTWFARRPGTLFRGLALAEFSNEPLSEVFFRANDFPGIQVADPFMGGGIPLIARYVGLGSPRPREPDLYGVSLTLRGTRGQRARTLP